MENSKTILIVDDEKVLIQTLLDYFESFHHVFTIQTASNGLEALEILQQTEVSLVVTDINMPKMDGITLLTHMMNDYPAVPCIVFSAYGTPELKTELENLGALYFLEKPFHLAELTERVLELLDKSEGGFLNSIALESFLQLLRMEQKSGIIELYHYPTKKKGYIFLSKGTLINASFRGQSGEKAMYEILGLEKEEIILKFHLRAVKKKKKIKKEMIHIIMEALKRKDEIQAQKEDVNEAIEDKEEPVFDLPDEEPSKKEAAISEMGRGDHDALSTDIQTNRNSKMIRSPGAAKNKTKEARVSPEGQEKQKGDFSNTFTKTLPKEEVMAIKKDVLKSLNSDVEGLQVASIFGADGLPLIMNNPGSLDVDAFSAKFAMVSKLISKTVKDLTEDRLQEILVEEDKGWMLVRPIGKSGLFLLIAVTDDATLGNLRLVAKGLASDIADSI